MRKNLPLISILVPVYNVSNYIEKCLISLFNQTYQNIEYVFVDDFSPDDSMDIVKKYISKYPNKKTKIIYHECNKGLSQTRNTLLENSTGEYVLYIDSDDWAEVNMVQKLVDKIILEDADICLCGFYEITRSKRRIIIENYPQNHLDALRAVTQLSVKGNIFKMLIKKELFTTNNLRFLPETKMAEDWIMSCKLYYVCHKLVSVQEPLYNYVRYNPTSYTARFNHSSLKNIRYQQEAIIEVERYFREKCIFDEVEYSLLLRKFIMKAPLVLNAGHYALWRRIFPECNYLWRELGYGKRQKLLFFLAQNHIDIMGILQHFF